MNKKIILTLLVMGMTLSSFGVLAQDTTTSSDSSTVEQTSTVSHTDVTEDTTSEAVVDEATDETVDETADETVENTAEKDSKKDKKTNKKVDEIKDEDVSEDVAKPEVTGKSNVIKDALKEKKQALAEAKLESKEFINNLKEFFKDADGETRKEILGEIAVLKKELKDLSIGTFVKGMVVDFEKYDGVKPVIENNRTLVPVRAITETLGAKVEWIEDTKTIIITKDENVIKMQLDNKTANVNGTDVELDVAPTTKNDRTLVPIRFIAESLNLTVEWDEDSQTIVVD